MSILRRNSRLAHWLAWGLLCAALLFLAYYYRQVWRVFALGPVDWLAGNSTLAAFLSGIGRFVADDVGFARFPALDEAFGRFGRALFGAVLVFSAIWAAGGIVLFPLRRQWSNWRLALLYKTGVGTGVLAYLMLALAFLGLYTPVMVRSVVSVLAIVGAVILFRTVRHINLAGILQREIHWFSADTVWKLITLIAVMIAFVGALAPEIEWDALWYHLWIPERWLEAGHPVDLIDEYISLYPYTVELLYGAAMTLGGVVAAKLIHFAFLPLGIILVYEMARYLVPNTSRWLAVALFACTPTIVWEATTAYVDLTLTVLVGLSLLSLIFFVNERKQHWLLLAAMTLGFAMATKHLSLLVLAIVGPGLFLLLWYRERQWRIVIRPTMIFIVICVLIPLPWYIRAWSASGNPFFPDLFGVFGALPELRWNEFTETGLQGFKDRFGVGRALPDLLLLPWHVTVNGYRFGGSLGPLYLLLISGLILPAVTHQKWLKWIGIFVLIFFVLWALPISSFQLRFLLLLTPWLAVLAAEGFGRIKLALHAGRKGNYVLTIGLAFLLLLNLPPFLSLHEGNQPGYADWLTHVVRTIPLGVVIGYESEASYLSRNVPTYAAWQAIDTLLPEDALILTFAGGDHLYATRDRYRDSAPRVIAPVWRATADAVEPARAALASAGVTHILYDKELLDSELGSLAIVQPDMVSAWDQPLYEDDHYFLLALRR